MKEKFVLLVDNSNTRTKFALGREGGIVELRVLRTEDITESAVVSILSGWTFDIVCLCSVVPQAAACIREALREYSVVSVCPDNAPFVDFSAYPGKLTLGADRVANAVAAAQCSPLPVIAVDLGTATTFDVVVGTETGPVFRGGLIAPGYAAVAASLTARTALLPDAAELADSPVIGRNTQEAMSSALRVGYPGMVDALLDALESELGMPAHVILTGGDAATVGPALRRKCRIEPLLTMQGIAYAAGFRL